MRLKLSLPALVMALLSGVGMGLALPPWGFWPLALLAPIYLWQLTTRPRGGYGLALGWGLGGYGLTLSWLTGLHPLTWMGIPWGASLAIALTCWGFVTLLAALIPVVWLRLMRWLRPQGPLALLLGAGLWVLLEQIWSQGPLWWPPLALGLVDLPGLPGLVRLSGPSVLSALVMAVSGGLWWGWQFPRARRRALAGAIALLLGGGLLGQTLLAMAAPDRQTDRLRLGIIQVNVPTRRKLRPEGLQLAMTRITSGYEQLSRAGAQAVLTSEGALPLLWSEQGETPLQRALATERVPLWLGTFMPVGDRYSQSLIALDPDGQVRGDYRKTRLVPLGESIPFEEQLGRWLRLSSIGMGMQAGQPGQQFTTTLGRAAASICYEIAFPELIRLPVNSGAEFLVTASNLDPYDRRLMAQHLAHARLRAIETDRWLVQATNTGWSAVVAPDGALRWRSPQHQWLTHLDDIHRRRTTTPWLRFGNWLPVSLVAIGLGLLARQRRVQR